MRMKPAAKHTFEIMDQTGHSTVEFDAADLAASEEKFKELTGLGYGAAVRDGDGLRKVKSFDPTAKETVFHPQLVGG